jgi:hypothetical protein
MKRGAHAQARIDAMAKLYEDGATLQEIGDAYKLTRERVRQLLTSRPHARPSRIDPVRIIKAARAARSLTETRAVTGYTAASIKRCLVELQHWAAISRLWKYRAKRHREALTNEELLSHLRKLATEIGRTPGIKDLNERPEYPWHMLYVKRFGSIRRAQELAGLRPNKVGGAHNARRGKSAISTIDPQR